MTTILGLFAVGVALLLFGFFMGREDDAAIFTDDDIAELARERAREELRARLREIRGRR